jgi:hypothetical protein
MADLPGGTVTFLLTDVVGSTALWAKSVSRISQRRHGHCRRLRNSRASSLWDKVIAPLSNIAAIRRRTAVNHVELSCVGGSIVATVNGTIVASVRDATYRAGRMWTGASVDRDALAFGIAMFDNLMVRGVPAPIEVSGYSSAPALLPANVASEAN